MLLSHYIIGIEINIPLQAGSLLLTRPFISLILRICYLHFVGSVVSTYIGFYIFLPVWWSCPVFSSTKGLKNDVDHPVFRLEKKKTFTLLFLDSLSFIRILIFKSLAISVVPSFPFFCINAAITFVGRIIYIWLCGGKSLWSLGLFFFFNL